MSLPRDFSTKITLTFNFHYNFHHLLSTAKRANVHRTFAWNTSYIGVITFLNLSTLLGVMNQNLKGSKLLCIS